MHNQVDNDSIVGGFLTKQTITKLLDEGDISSNQYDSFFNFARSFYVKSVEYFIKFEVPEKLKEKHIGDPETHIFEVS